MHCWVGCPSFGSIPTGPLIYPPTHFRSIFRQTGFAVQLFRSAKFICMGKRKNLLTAVQSLCTLCTPKKSPRPNCANHRLGFQKSRPFFHSPPRSRVMRVFSRGVQVRRKPTYPVPRTDLPCSSQPTLYLNPTYPVPTQIRPENKVVLLDDAVTTVQTPTL